MINLRNALTLAGTKLKTRKVRLAVTVIISSLMFGVLAIGIISFSGFTNSIERFSQEGLNARFFTQVRPMNDGNWYIDYRNHFSKPETLARAKQIANELVEVKAARAKELGLEFDKKMELLKLLPEPSKPLDEKPVDEIIDTNGPIGKQLLKEYFESKPTDPQTKLNKTNIDRITAGYDVLNISSQNTFMISSGTITRPAKNGGYPISAQNDMMVKQNPSEDQPIIFRDATTASEDIVAPFRLKNAKWSAESNTIPIFISFTEAQSLLGLKALPNEATAKERLARNNDLRDKIAGFKINHCYRNELAMEQLQQAALHESQKNIKDYVAPELIYGLPANNACQIAPILSDKRSAATKKLEAARHQFDVEFNQRNAEPIAKEITFEVVGVIPSSEDTMSQSLASQLVGIAIGSPNLNHAVSETDFQAALQKLGLEKIFTSEPDSNPSGRDNQIRIVEFGNLSDAKDFMDKHNCLQFSFFEDGSRQACSAERPFLIMPTLNNRLSLQSAVETFFKLIIIALAVAVVIATIIMAGTVGRMIADSRRETAVFRAIGFKRFDIARVYGLYTFIVCLFIIGVSLAIGFGGAGFIASRLDKDLTIFAALATGTTNSSLKMSMIGISPTYLGLLIAAILVVGLLAIILPLIRNLRRNPIKDMRDE